MDDLKFTHSHEWLQSKNDEVIVGITEHAQQLLGDMVFIEMPKPGDEVNAGDELGVVESVKAASDFYAPVSGVILEVNQDACNNPSIVNTDPYGAGWLVKMRASNTAELNTLLTVEQYENEIAEDN